MNFDYRAVVWMLSTNGPLVQRGLANADFRHLTGGLRGILDNPSVFASQSHLPLHKGGFGSCNIHQTDKSEIKRPPLGGLWFYR